MRRWPEQSLLFVKTSIFRRKENNYNKKILSKTVITRNNEPHIYLSLELYWISWYTVLIIARFTHFFERKLWSWWVSLVTYSSSMTATSDGWLRTAGCHRWPRCHCHRIGRLTAWSSMIPQRREWLIAVGWKHYVSFHVLCSHFSLLKKIVARKRFKKHFFFEKIRKLDPFHPSHSIYLRSRGKPNRSN